MGEKEFRIWICENSEFILQFLLISWQNYHFYSVNMLTYFIARKSEFYIYISQFHISPHNSEEKKDELRGQIFLLFFFCEKKQLLSLLSILWWKHASIAINMGVAVCKIWIFLNTFIGILVVSFNHELPDESINMTGIRLVYSSMSVHLSRTG